MMHISIFTQPWVGCPPSEDGQATERQAFVKLIIFGVPVMLTVAMAEELQMALGQSIGQSVAMLEQADDAPDLISRPAEGRA